MGCWSWIGSSGPFKGVTSKILLAKDFGLNAKGCDGLRLLTLALQPVTALMIAVQA
jgi:hypothetical protein